MSQARPASLGIDVAKAKFDVALLCEGKLSQSTFSMNAQGFTALGLWIHKQGVEQVHACLEATGEYGAALALALACFARLANAAGLAIASSDRLLRSSVTPAFFSPLMNCP